MTQEPAFDVYLSYSRQDVEIVRELERYLIDAGLNVWRDETGISTGAEWQSALATAFARSSFVAICVGPRGLGKGQLEEVEGAVARAATEPDFRFAAVLLPGVPEDFSPSLLPFQLADRQWIDLRSGLAEARKWARELAKLPRLRPVQSRPPATPSLENAAMRLSGEVTAAAFVSELLKLHPEYGERRGAGIELDRERGERATAQSWLEKVRGLLDATAVIELHGRLFIVGLARVDSSLHEQLERGGFLAAVEREIREPLARLFTDQPPQPEETVPTHTDNPATVDELNREGYARILARRIRDMRMNETAVAKSVGEEELPFGRSFLVHVHGPWGIGKTSLLNFLRDELHKPDPEPWVVVTFNAWQHQRLAPPWWWLMSSLYHRAFRELWRISPRRALRFRGREWFWRLRGGWLGLAMIIVGAATFVLIWRAGFFESLGEGRAFSLDTIKGLILSIAVVLTPLLTIWGVVKSAARWLLTTSARGARVYIENARDPMQTTKDHFAQLVEWLEGPLAIIIDDLDRCKPPFVVELLEGIQTLFRDVPVAYIVAADREWLAASYSAEYNSFDGAFDEPGRPLGYLFLEKTFQMTLPVPAMNAETRDTYWRQLIRPRPPDDRAGLDKARAAAAKIFQALRTEEEVRRELARNPGDTPAEQRARLEAAAIQLATPKLEQAAEHVLQPFRPLLETNPRAMKRLVNAYGLARGVELLSRHTLGGDKLAQHRTALWTVLSLRWPRLAEYLATHPNAAASVGTAPQGVPTDLAKLFTDPEVEAVILGQAEGVSAKLDPDSIRLCVSA
jgi:hypothetical protein